MQHRKPTSIVIFVFVAVMILAAGCVAGQPLIVQAPPAQTDTAEVAAAVDAIWQEYVDSRLAGDAERAMSIWDEEGVQMPPDTAPRVGKAAIAAAVTANLERVTYLEMEVVPEELSVSGDIAISRGHYTVTRVAKAGGDPVYTDGKFMTFIRRQPDGSWKIYRDIFNSNVPPAPAPAATTNVDEVAAAVDAIWREYEASLIAGDADRWIAQWMDDGVQMPPNMPPRVGKDTIYTAVSGFLSNFEYTEFAIVNEDVEVNGDLAFARGTYDAAFVAKSGGDPTHVEGKYMTIMRQQPDGSWKIYRDIFNSNVPPDPAPAATTDVDEVAAAVDAIWREYEASILAGDPERWIALWVDDGVQMPPGVPPNVGKETILAGITEDLATYEYTEFVISNEDVEVDGNLAFARGTYVVGFAPKSGGDTMHVDGKYMTIFRHQPDGSWKIYRDIFNSNVPPSPAPAASSDDEDVTAAVEAIWREYEAAQMASDPERWIALWTDNGVKMPPNSPAIEGTDGILARVQRGMTNAPVDEMVITSYEVQSAGDWAYSRGIYTGTYTIADTGVQEAMDGKFMTILQRQPDGSWKIHRDISNNNAPPPSPEDDIAALSAELHQHFSDNDLEGAAALADENIKMVGFGLGLDLQGREQFLSFMQARKRAFPDITLEHTNLVVQGDQVVVEFVATGTHLGPLMTPNGEVEATGKPVTLHVVEIHTWHNGKLVNLVQYQDPTSPLRQIGVMQ